MTNSNQSPVGFRGGKAFYDPAALAAYDKVAAANQKVINDAEAAAIRLAEALQRVDDLRAQTVADEDAKAQAAHQHELHTAETEAYMAHMSELAQKVINEAAAIGMREGQDAYDAYLAALDPDIRDHVRSEAAKAQANVWGEPVEAVRKAKGSN